MDIVLAAKIALGFILGGLIGLEREINEKKVVRPNQKPMAILGVRSFALIGGFGALMGLFVDKNPLFFGIVTAAFMLLTLSFYIIDTLTSKDTGITTEIAMFYAFLIGTFLTYAIIPIQLTLAITVILLLILSKKERIKNTVDDIKRREVNAFISYAIVALVILPFLPNETYLLKDIPFLVDIFEALGVNLEKLYTVEIINPFKLWFIVALITGVDLLGYLLERTFGQRKGWLLASVAGGFVSSTATTQTLAQQSKQTKHINHLLAAAIFANMASFFQLSILIAPLNATYYAKALPTILIMIITSGIIGYFFLRKKEGKETVQLKAANHQIFNLVPALKFAGIFLLVGIIAEIAYALFGSRGFLIAAGISALTGIDAILINTAELAGKTIDYTTAILALIIVNAVNLMGKSFYSFLQGSRPFAIRFGWSMGAMIMLSLLGLFFA